MKTKEYIFIKDYTWEDYVLKKTYYFKYGDIITLRKCLDSNYYFFNFTVLGVRKSDIFFNYVITIEEFIKLRNEKIEKIIQREE